MARKTIFRGTVERLDVLRTDGTVDATQMPEIADEKLQEAYRLMVLMRALDEKAVKMQRQGRMGTWAQLKGQEASQAGMAAAMNDGDWLVPSFREHGLMLSRGVPGELIYAYWKGFEKGGAIPRELRCLPPSVPIGSQLLHGAGLGYALKRRGENTAAVACGGDGSTSEGDFHEALNFAGVYNSQTVFFVQNNGWAISLPVSSQTASETIAQKAIGYGFPGVQVDGNDFLAVYSVCKEALERARNGGGPTLIEAVTYRLGDHTTADDASRYRTDEERDSWAERDPLVRMRVYLTSRGLWSDSEDELWNTAVGSRVEQVVSKLESFATPNSGEIFDSMYEELPWNLKEQKEELRMEVAGG